MMALLLRLGGAFGMVLFNALIAVFSARVLEKGMAALSFRSLRWIAARTTNDVDNDVVREAEIAYYGEEKYAKVFNRPAGNPGGRSGYQRKDPVLDISRATGSQSGDSGGESSPRAGSKPVPGPSGEPESGSRESGQQDK